ncbi:MAG: glycosyltransferase family 1 protein [bacterium]|nr:glycosyltransferase family 1 protein [bacterium]
MRILIDLRCLQSPPPRGGVAHYAEDLTRHLLRRDRGNAYELFANGLVAPAAHLPTFTAPHARWRIWRLPNKVFKVAHALSVPAGRLAPDVAWLPNLDYIPFLHPKTRIVVTVHDLSFEHFPDCFTTRQRAWHRLLRPHKLLHRADAIVAVSETTKRDIIETYGIPEAKVHVIMPGIDCTHDDASAPPLSCALCCILPEGFPFILSLSEISPRKNLDGLVAAFELLDTPLHLVIAGKSGSAVRALRRQITRSPAADRIHLIGAVAEHEKTALLARATCFVVPSFWEGFGFPPLEAMVAGVPVIASAHGSLPEVLGDAALFVDPRDPAAIARALRLVTTDAAFHATLIARGSTQARKYQWNDAAEQLHHILTERMAR